MVECESEYHRLSAKKHRAFGSTVPTLFKAVLPATTTLLVLTGLAISLQWLAGAYSGAFGGQWDEAAHYVTGLMIRDYLVDGVPANPLDFARDYYVHYPRVAFGLWPPVFHIVSAVWMLLFGVDRSSVLILMAAVTALWAYLAFRLMRHLTGTWQAAASALLLVCLPGTQMSASAVMLDMPLCLVMLLAAAAYAKYLNTMTMRHAVEFGVLAAIAVLVKYNAIALVFLPLISVVVLNRFDLLRRKSFWAPAAIVVVLAGPWYAAMYRLVLYAAEPGAPFPSIWYMAARNAEAMFVIVGPAIGLLAAAGALLVIRPALVPGTELNPATLRSAIHVVAFASVLSIWLFHSFVYPISEIRYVVPAAPFLILLAWIPLNLVLRTARGAVGRGWAPVAVALAIMLVPFAAFTFHVPQKNTEQLVKVVDAIEEQSLPEHSVILVSSDAAGEGMFVAEMAMREKRPGSIIARASKVLADRRLMGQDYRLLYNTPEELMKALDSFPVNVAVIEDCPEQVCGKHTVLLAECVRTMSARWRLLGSIQRENGRTIGIYRLAGNEGKSVKKLQADLRHALGTVIIKESGAQAVGRKVPN